MALLFQEYIDRHTGMLFSMDSGLALFNLRDFYLDGVKPDRLPTREELPPGTWVSFLDAFHECPDYKAVSKEGFLRQARAVWTGPRPHHLLKSLMTETENDERLAEDRGTFVDHVRAGRFLSMPLVRARGQARPFSTFSEEKNVN